MIVISGLEPKQYRITADGIAELEQQLEDLKLRRRDVADEMREISSQSTDLGALEDSTLAVNQNQATELDGQITLLERIIGMATVIERPTDTDTVQVGSQVTVAINGEEKTYTIVGLVEADPMEGKISDESPLGQSLLGRSVDDKIEILSPSGQKTAATIVRIS